MIGATTERAWLRGPRPTGAEGTGEQRPEEQDASVRRDRPLRCWRCGHPVTSAAARIHVSGAHEHTFANPVGVIYQIGCFSVAPGAFTVGPPEADTSWFPGTRWTLAGCDGCAAHLGWAYDRGASVLFFGLILDRLAEAH